jgi:signal transduction histidine kinase
MPPARRSGAAHAQGITPEDAWGCVGRLAAEIAGSADLREIAEAILSHGVRAVHASGGLVGVPDVDATGALRVLASQGYDGASKPAIESVPLDADAPLAEAGRSGRPVIVSDIAAMPGRWADGPLVPRSGALACLPLEIGEDVTGVLEFRWDASVRFDPATRRIVDAIAAIAAQALGRSSVTDAARRARAEALQADVRSGALAAVAEAFSAARDEEAVLDALVGSGLPPAGATSAAVLRLDESGSLTAVRLVGYPEGVRAPSQNLPVADAIRRGEPVIVPDPESIARMYPDMADLASQIGARTIVALPLVAHGRQIGGVRLGFPDERAVAPATLRYLATLADATAQAYERARLYAAERRWWGILEAVIRQLPVGVAVAEAPSGRLVLVNDRLRSAWGVANADDPSAQGATAPRPRMAGYHLDGRRYRDGEWPLDRSLRLGEIVTDERIEVTLADGSRGVMSVSSGPVLDEHGGIVLGAAVVADVTERVRTERLRDAFIGVLSHELRTPITAIYGGSKVLLRRARPVSAATRRELLEDMAAEAERMHRLVENLLVLARTERGMDLHAADPVLLQHQVPRVIDSVRAQWPEVEFHLSIPERLPTVSGDDGYVEQVLRNLLSNAAKYGPPGGPVEVSLRQAGEEVQVLVLDRGPGVGDEAQDVFELFYRSGRTAAAAPGAGIGLFVARQLAIAMGGRIWAADRPGGGAVFGFSLPLFDVNG